MLPLFQKLIWISIQEIFYKSFFLTTTVSIPLETIIVLFKMRTIFPVIQFPETDTQEILLSILNFSMFIFKLPHTIIFILEII